MTYDPYENIVFNQLADGMEIKENAGHTRERNSGGIRTMPS